ncbi:putative apyrase 7 [Forsythia ovata]|uniref:Apyrase 7 n=1 Tax=Forsythia ovata TaxID=205694 RepID=A0ABD1X8F6_9LAMI
MVFSKFAEIVSSATARLSAPKSSTLSYKSPGFLPVQDSLHGYTFSSPENKTSLRLSSSLQDLSTYRRLDPEAGDLNPGIERSSSHATPPNALQNENGGLSFSKEKASSVIPSRRKKWIRKIWFPEWTGLQQNGNRNLGLTNWCIIYQGLKGAIKPLVRWAKRQIPKKSHKTTSLFLYATAGVRRLPSSDSEWLLNNAWLILKNSPFLCKREWVKIITGVEEAYYGWIALNYNMGVLGATPKKETFGALDLGGSSLQVTFEGKEAAHDETSLKLRIGSVNHHLTAYSLSGYGLNDAFDKSVAHLLKRRPHITNADLVSGNVEIKHPCLQYGYKEQYTCSNCAFVHQEGGSPAQGKKMGKGAKAGVPVQLVGTPNWQKCNALAKIAVNLSEWSDHSPGIDCELQPCALADNLPRPLGQFYAMSGFYVVYRFFNLTPDAALDDVLDKGQEFCEKTWDVAKKSVAPQPFIEQYCFRAPYVVLLLREGLHITDRDVIIGSGSITWTLGVALLEAGKAFPNRVEFHKYNIFRVKINPVLLFAILFASLFVLVCALSCIGNGVAKFFRRPYLPLFRHNSVTSTSVLNISSPFQFQHWSPINTGDGRVKMPLSPTIAGHSAKTV